MELYNPFSLQGKSIIVTGASSGIGKAIAIECARMGANVLITGRNKERLQETFDLLIGDNHTQIIADLKSYEEIVQLAEKTASIDGLVHCAGFTIPKPFSFLSQTDISSVMQVNFEAPVLLTQCLLKRKKINKQASVVFISSISGVYISSVAGSIYSASKGAVNGLVKGIALELAPKGIRVNSVNPAMIDTNIYSSGVIDEEMLKEDVKKYPLKRYGKPEEVAYAVIYLLSDASAWVTGSNLVIDGGYTIQ